MVRSVDTATRRWFRLDVEWYSSDWIAPMHGLAQLAWVRLLGHVKQNGSMGKSKALTPTAAGLLWRIPAKHVATMLEAARGDGALTVQDGEWVLTKWVEYVAPPIRPRVLNRWKLLRLEVLERDDWTCRYCGAFADQCDHVKSRKRGGTDDPANLVAACGFCNRSKRDLPLDEWKLARGAVRHA